MSTPLARSWLCLLAALVSSPFSAPVGAQGLPSGRPEEAGLSADAMQRIDSTLRAYVESGKVPGIVAAVARHGRVVYLQAFGQMDLENGTPMRTDAVFRAYSLTKPVTSVAVLRLYEQGKLRLDDPVSKFIPAFEGTAVYDGGSAAHPEVRPLDRPITIQHLLTHTAGLGLGLGFTHTPVDSIYSQAGVLRPAWTNEQFSDSVARLPLLFSPGEAWHYSVATAVLGRVVEVASGKPLDQYFEEEILRPLGMTETSFRLRPETRDRLAKSYVIGPGSVGLRPRDPSRDAMYLAESRLLLGDRGLLSTPGDYLRFAQMLLNGGELDGVRILQPETVALMVQNHLPPTILASPALVGQPGYGFGLGFAVLVHPAAAGLPGAAGIYRWWGAAGTFFWVDPHADLIGMVWTQVLPGRAYPLEQDFQSAVYRGLTESVTRR